MIAFQVDGLHFPAYNLGELLPLVMKTFLLPTSLALLLTLPVSELTRDLARPLVRRLLALGTRSRITIDEEGIPVFDYGEVAGLNMGKQRNPLFIAGQGLRYHRQCLDGNPETCKRSQACADWLVANAKLVDDFANLQYHFPWPNYGMEPPWRSGLANSRGWQLLDRVSEHSGKASYRDTARRLVRSFARSVENGGITSKSPSGWWYLEYVDNWVTVIGKMK